MQFWVMHNWLYYTVAQQNSSRLDVMSLLLECLFHASIHTEISVCHPTHHLPQKWLTTQIDSLMSQLWVSLSIWWLTFVLMSQLTHTGFCVNSLKTMFCHHSIYTTHTHVLWVLASEVCNLTEVTSCLISKLDRV